MFFINDFISANQSNFVEENFGHSYSYNENGHRTKPLKQLDTSNYILFTGCSHTEGTGLSVEETYPYVTSKLLGMDYYNLGAKGSGCDIMFYNIFTWLNKFVHKPKLIVVQWPYQLRYARYNTPDNITISKEGNWSQDKYKDFMLLGDRVGYFDLRTHLYDNLLKQIDIPKVYVSFPIFNIKIQDYISFDTIDKAHDNKHNGPKSHRLLSEKIVDKYLNVDTYSNTRGQSD